MQLTTVYDCMGSNLDKFSVPAGVLMAGYTTGQGGVPWTAKQFAANPRAVRIDQSPVNTPADELADVLDVENAAATIADTPEWVKAAWANYRANKRPGQRTPVIYMSKSTVTPVVNAFIVAGVTADVGIWLASPMDSTAAIQLVTDASGPFPIVGVQYAFLPDHDVSVVNTAWLDNVSGRPAAPPPAPGTQSGWRYCSKCKSLFFGPQEAISHCPVGAQHDGSRSHDFTLGFIQ